MTSSRNEIGRRDLLMVLAGSAALPGTALAATPRNLQWDDLIPPGVPYSEIVGIGEMDEVNDTWNPIFDENGTKLNEDLNGAYVRMPGYIIPLEFTSEGVSQFILVPYVGACIHVPPPPPNQLVFVTSTVPWPSESLWDAVWVTGTMRTQLQSTEIAEIGYALAADRVDPFSW